MRELNLKDPNPPRDRRAHAESVLLLVTQGSEEHWGELEPLRGTSWEAGVSLIPAEAYSEALHGRLMPLLRALGRPPEASARRVSPVEGACALKGSCAGWEPQKCRPGGRAKKRGEVAPPECWEPPLEGAAPAISQLFREVAMAWREGRHTIVVVGEGFNLL